MKEITKQFIEFSAKETYMEKEGEKWCVRCALGNAAGDFRDKHKEFNIEDSEILRQGLMGFEELEQDSFLVEARDFLASKDFELLFDSKEKAIEFMLSSVSSPQG